MLILIAFFIAALAGYAVLLAVRMLKKPGLSKSAFNERVKYMAAGCDRASTACFIAAVVTPETQLTQIELGVSSDAKRLIFFAVWSLAAIALHLTGNNLLSRIRD